MIRSETPSNPMTNQGAVLVAEIELVADTGHDWRHLIGLHQSLHSDFR